VRSWASSLERWKESSPTPWGTPLASLPFPDPPSLKPGATESSVIIGKVAPIRKYRACAIVKFATFYTPHGSSDGNGRIDAARVLTYELNRDEQICIWKGGLVNMPKPIITYGTRKALEVHLGESAARELVSVLQTLSDAVAALEKKKVDVTPVAPEQGVELVPPENSWVKPR
jgi:hypothetical protein